MEDPEWYFQAAGAGDRGRHCCDLVEEHKKGSVQEGIFHSTRVKDYYYIVFIGYRMKTNTQYHFSSKKLISLVIVFGLVSFIFIKYCPCSCMPSLSQHNIDSDDCCDYCVSDVKSINDLFGFLQKSSSPNLQKTSVPDGQADEHYAESGISRTDIAFANGPPWRLGPAVHIRSTVLLI